MSLVALWEGVSIFWNKPYNYLENIFYQRFIWYFSSQTQCLYCDNCSAAYRLPHLLTSHLLLITYSKPSFLTSPAYTPQYNAIVIPFHIFQLLCFSFFLYHYTQKPYSDLNQLSSSLGLYFNIWNCQINWILATYVQFKFIAPYFKCSVLPWNPMKNSK